MTASDTRLEVDESHPITQYRQCDMKHKDWCAVEFGTDSQDTNRKSNPIEVVPSLWLKKQADKTFTCKWPHKNIRNRIRKRAAPGNTWTEHTATVLFESDDYEVANDFVKRKTKTDTETSNPELGRGKRKRKAQVRASDTSDYSDTELHISPPPSLHLADIVTEDDTNENQAKKDLNKNIRTAGDGGNRNLHLQSTEIHSLVGNVDSAHENTNSTEEYKVAQNENLDKGLPLAHDKPSSSSIEDNSAARNRDFGTERDTVGGPKPSIIRFINHPRREDIVVGDKITGDSPNVLSILENVISIRKMVEQQNTYLSKLENKENQQYQPGPVAVNAARTALSMIPKKPFKKYDKLKDFDTALKTDAEGQKQMEEFFYLLGGKDSQEQVKVGMEKLISNKLAIKCSWMGRKANSKVNDLLVMEILKRATRKRFANLDDKTYKDHVSAWLRHGNTRYKRDQLKKLQQQEK